MHIVSLVAELLAYPLGVGIAHALPISRFNPDRHFNIKEHALVTIMSNVSFGFGSADATNIIQAAKYYGFTLKTGFSVMVVLCCQLLGYGVAGLSARWLVEPASMIWPGVLSNIALLSSLHSRANAVADGWRISRIKFFMVVGGIAFVWYWFPGLIFTGLSYFTWICWIAPNNIAVNQVFGMVTGMVRLSDAQCPRPRSNAVVHKLLYSQDLIGTISADLRLVHGRIQHQPPSKPALGCSQRLLWFRRLLLDHYSSAVLHQYLVHRLFAILHG